MRKQTMSKQIRSLSELMVFVGLTSTTRQANGLIKKGIVFLDDIRCATTDLNLVLVHPCLLNVRSSEDLTTIIDGVILDIQEGGFDRVAGDYH